MHNVLRAVFDVVANGEAEEACQQASFSCSASASMKRTSKKPRLMILVTTVGLVRVCLTPKGEASIHKLGVV